MDKGFGSMDPPEGIATPVATPSRTPVDSLTTAFQGASLTQTHQTASSLGHHAPSRQLGGQPQFAMYPMLFRNNFQPGNPLLMDQMQPRPHMVSPMAGNFHMMGSMFAPTGAAFSPLHVTGDFGSPRSVHGFHRPNDRRQHAMRVSRSSYYNAASHHNHVDVIRIREGTDVRTTVGYSHMKRPMLGS